MRTQTDKAKRFHELHERAGTFIIPNPWDVGSARLLAALGFEALATTSAGFARAQGFPDYRIGRDAVLDHVRALAPSVDLPLSGDLENGFGDDPKTVADTIRLAAEAGLVGGSIEDSTGRKDAPQYELAHAKDRVRAAVEAARGLAFPFTLTARAENFFTGVPDLRDTIARLQAYEDAGADVLYAPSLPTLDAIRSVVSSVGRPVNVLIGPKQPVNVRELAAIGVKRISLGSALASVASSALLRAARELLSDGSFEFTKQLVPGKELDRLIAEAAPGL